MTIEPWIAAVTLLATVAGPVGGAVAWMLRRHAAWYRALDDVAAHSRKGREALGRELRDELRRAVDDVRREADRVFATREVVSAMNARLDAIETKLGEIHAAVVPHSSTR